MRVRLLDHGRVLYGGSPPRFVKLSEAGRRRALSLLASDPDHTARTPASDRLRQRLVSAGILDPIRPDASSSLPSVGFVIPHFNDPTGAAATVATVLAAWGKSHSGERGSDCVAVVVDDGSRESARDELHTLLDPFAPTVRVMYQPVNGGPAAARNSGANEVDADILVFVDCTVSFEDDALDWLVRWFLDSATTAVAPRIRPSSRGGVILRYEEHRSPLDVVRSRINGPTLVGRARPVAYVPTTVLAVRADAFQGVGGFDEALRYGEDVDLIWRLEESGARVLLDPAVVAHHPARSTVVEFAAQRFWYGTSAGPLGSRHGSAVAPVMLRPELAMAVFAWLVTPAGGTGAAMVVAWDAVRRSLAFSRLADGAPGVAALGALESVRFNLASALSVVSAMGRTWWPVTAMLMVQPWSRRLRRRTTEVVVARLFGQLRTVGAAQLALAVLDDLAYGSGVWWGALEERRPAALLPRLLRGR